MKARRKNVRHSSELLFLKCLVSCQTDCGKFNIANCPHNPALCQADCNTVLSSTLFSICCAYHVSLWHVHAYIEDILPKGPYSPCLRMADRALLGRIPSISCVLLRCIRLIADVYTARGSGWLRGNQWLSRLFTHRSSTCRYVLHNQRHWYGEKTCISRSKSCHPR